MEYTIGLVYVTFLSITDVFGFDDLLSRSVSFKVRTQYRATTPPDLTTSSTSKIGCALTCTSTSSCIAFSYNHQRNICEVRYTFNSTEDVTVDAEWATAYKTECKLASQTV